MFKIKIHNFKHVFKFFNPIQGRLKFLRAHPPVHFFYGYMSFCTAHRDHDHDTVCILEIQINTKAIQNC